MKYTPIPIPNVIIAAVLQADLSHMFWSCPNLGTYWCSVFDIFSTLSNNGLQPCPLLANFGVPAEPLPCNSNEVDMIAFATLLARRRLLPTWKPPTAPPPPPPPYSLPAERFDVVFAPRKNNVYTLEGLASAFLKKWQPSLSQWLIWLIACF